MKSAKEPLGALSDPGGVVTVTPDSMHGWIFADDQHDAPCTDVSQCALANGPGVPPLGGGSLELATPAAASGNALILPAFKGTRFDRITALRYSTYRQSVDNGNNLAIALQFNVDFDLDDGVSAYQGRLVFEPYQGTGGNVPRNVW